MMHTDGTVSITVNGEHRRVAAGLTIADLADELGLVPDKGRGRAQSRNRAAFDAGRRCWSRMATSWRSSISSAAAIMRAGRRRQLDRRGQDLPLAADRRHRQVQGFRAECRGGRGVGRGDRHRRGAPGQRVDPQRADADRLYRSRRRSPICPTPPAASTPTARSARCGWRARRAAGIWSSSRCWARRARSIPTWSRRCARPRCWRRKASSRWSIASTIRSRRSSWRMPARSRSCRWARRSARASASRTA